MSRHASNVGVVTLLCLGVAAYSKSLAVEPVSDTTLPTGGQVAAGQVSISQSGSHMKLLQSSDRAVVNWQSFDVGSAAEVQFQQPSATSSVLNRVASQAPSQIFGKISANGQVFLLNANGVIFGRDAQVDVGGMIAGAMKITDENYLNGNQVFTDGQGAVINQGSLTATEGGLIALLAPEVINEGVIRAKLGTIILAAGEAITLTNSLTGMTVVVEQSAIDALVDNRHLISAEDGTVFISARDAAELQASVVTNSGVVEARSARQVGGLIRLEAGSLQNTGVLDASSSADNGGSIEIIADRLNLSGAELKVNGALIGGEIHLSATDISLLDGTRLSAVGDLGGGDIAIGGGWQGETINDSPAAVTVLMGSDVQLDASAAVNGDGGEIVLWSDVADQHSETRVSGTMLATGGVISGQGGRVETSGHYLDVAGVRVDTQAQNGDAGLWLLDPSDIVISQSTTLNTTADSAGTFTPTSGSNESVIQVEDILTALASSNVTITTTNENVAGSAAGNINIQADIAYTGSNNRSLTLIADNEINQDAATAISSANATLNLVLDNAVGGVVAGTIGAPGGDDVSITKQGAGSLTLTGTNTYTGGTTISAGELRLGDGGTSGSITGDIANAGTLTFNRADTVNFADVISGTGDLVQAGLGTLNLTGDNIFTGGTTISAGELQLGVGSTNGSIIGDIANAGTLIVNRSDAITLEGLISGAGDLVQEGVGTTTLTGTNTYSGGTTISAGELQLGAGSMIGSITGDIANAGTLIFNRSDDITFSGVISGTGDLVQGGSGVLTLNGENLYSGSTELAAGTLSLGSAAAIGELGVIGFSGGSLRHSALNVTDYSPRFSTLSGHVQFDIDTGGEDVSYGSPLDTATSTITKRGLGSLTLSDSSRYVGTVVGSTSISAGTLVLKVADITTLTSAERISGLGSLAIVPLTTSFSADFSLGDLNLGANDGSVIGNLTVGAPGNTANISLNDLPGNLVVTDNQSYYAGTVTIPIGASPGITAMTSGVLTLSAQTSVSILEPITVSGSGGVAIQTSQNAASGGTGTYDLGVSATGFLGGISFDNSTGQTFTTQDGTNVANLKNYNLVGSLAELSSASLSGNIALKNSLDAASYVITNSDSSISNYGNVLAGQFTGTFTGLGNTIVNLVLRKTSDESGIFQSIRNAKLSDLRVLDSSVVGRNHTGLIVGRAYSTVSLSGLVVDASSISGDSNPHFIGALVGYADSGTLNNSWVVDSAVSGYYMVGGLIGHSRISADGVHNLNTDVSATNNYLGGLYGYTPGATTINNSSSSGAISGINYVGGLVGGHDGAVSNSFVTGSVSATGVYVGGLMGHHRNGNLNNVYMTGDVSGGGERVGGLVGWLSPNISFVNSYVSGAVSGRNRVGGLAGYSDSQLLIDNSYFSGASVTGSSGNSVAGFIGEIAGNLTIQDAYVSTPLIQSTGGGYVGGFVGYARSAVTISDSYVTTALISGTANYIGGLIGHTDSAATINRAYVAASGGTAVTGVSFVAGLTGRINGAGYISDSYFGGSVAATGTNYGGLVGYIMPNTYIANSYYDIDNSLINGVKTVSIGGLFAGQYADWVNSSQTLSSRSLAIGNYFSAPDTNGYYAISSYIDNSNEAGGNPSGQSDLSNLLGFIESGSAFQANGFKFKLANDIDMAAASIPYLPYLSVTELLGNGFEVNNFSWNRPTSSVGFIGHAYKSLLVDMTVNTSVYSGQTDTSYAINAEDYVGTLVGSIFDGRIENSHTILAGTVLGNTIVGGAVGMITNSPVITASAVRAAGVVAADAQVVSVGDYVGGFAGLVTTGAMQGVDSDLSIQGSAAYVGGLVGKANGTIADVSAIGDVVGANDYVGGLIGYQATGSVTNATAIGDVIGSSRVGGLLGYSNSNVTNTQASGDVVGANDYVGGLIGYQATGSITDVTAIGDVTGSSWVGGLLGYSNSHVTNTQASGDVTGRLRYVGGLIGKQVSGTVSDSSYLTGTVSGQGYVGGLIGHVDNKSAVVLGSYSTGGVSASEDFVGGLIGFMEGKLDDSVTTQPTGRGSLHSYATGDVTGRYDVGGLIGRLASYGVVANSYASGDVTAAANYGGVLGYLTPGATVTNTHYDMGSVLLSAFTTASPSALVDVTGTVTLGGLYSGQYTTWFNGGALDGLGNPEIYFGAADGTGVYSLSTIQHLKDYLGFADQASLSFKLTADFDLAADNGFYIPYVSGLLDTNGVSISNLMLDQLTSNLGFVGHYYSASDTSISGLTLSGEITGMMNLGLAAGSTWQRGFNLVSGSGSVTGSNIAYANLATNEDERTQNNYGYSNVGGLLGYGWGSASTPLTVSNLASSAHVLGGNNVGGLAGYIEYGAMSGSSSTGTVESIAMSGYTIYRTGGLVGWLNQNNSSVHSSSHSVGLVKGFNYVGGLVGEFRGALGEAVVDATPTYSTWVSSSVEGSGQRIGGLVGYHAAGSLTNAEMTGSVTGWVTNGSTNFSGTYTGGITGYSSPGITYSRYAGSLIKGGERTGGIVGQIDTTMSNVIASGQVLGGGSYVGGIAGYGRRIQDAVSTADIFGQSNFVGGLAGQADSGIYDSSASGQVSGHINGSGLNFAGTYVGGLVGYSNNVIRNSHATGSLVKGGHQTGGLVGHTDNHVYDSYATADVETNSSYSGGLVGLSHQIIYDSYATGDVTTNNAYSGGLGGYVRAIYDSYATGNVTSTSSYVGGLAGVLQVADNAYATGTVSGSSYVGGFVGEQQGGGTVSDSYATGAVTSNGSQVGGFAGRINGAISNSFANGSVVGSTYTGGFVGYQNSGSIINSFTNGDVSAIGDYVGGFVGYQNSGRITNTSSTGSVYTPAKNYVGGFVGQSNGTITDSTVVISTVNETSGFGVFGHSFIGGFSGYNQGAISNSTATASIKGQASTGGFVGRKVAGTISSSGAFGSVTGTNAVGGFAGRVDAGTISSSYSNSLVVGSSTDATTFVGGFVGYLDNGAITTSRAAGAVSGSYRVGGFVGSMFGSGSIGQSYATGAVTQYSTSTAGTSGGVGGFAGYLDDAQTGALTDIYAMGSVTGTQQVGGLVGYAGRGTITNGFSTGAVSSSSGATSIGGALGVVNQTFLANTSTLPVTQSAVYFDTDSSGLLQDGAGGTSVGQATIELKSVLPSNFNQLNWSTSTDLYPYLSVFYPITPHAISGLASLSNGEVAVAAQVNHYSHGVLLNGGAASTGADGSYYSIVGSRSLMPDANVPGAIESITLDSGGSGYTSVPILTLADSAGFNALGSVTLGANQMITNISFTAGNGSGATATASIDTDSLSATFRTVNDINLITAGDYYTSRPVLTFAGGTTGTVATATVTTRSLLASTLLGSTLTLNGSTDVAGLSYSDSLTLNNGNLSDSLVQGLSVIRTNALSDSLLSADLDLTFGSAVRAEFQDALTQRSSLELIAEGESFDLDLALDYRDGNLANAGNITVTNNALTLSAGSFYSSGFQTYMGAMTLASDTLVTATTLNTSSILTGSLTSLEIDGNFDAGGALSGLTTLLVRGDTVLAGTVSTSDDQTYLGDLVLDSAANTLITTEVGSVGGSLNVSGAITSSGAVHDLTVLAGQGAITFAGDIGGGLGFDHINLSANTLALSGVEATQSVDITVATNGSVASIAGAANLIKNGAGTLSLNAVNTYSGSTHINSGSLALINAGSLGQGNYAQVIDIANNATFQYASSGEQILSGVLSGGGTLVKDTADSTLTLTGVNTFAGDIDLDAGVLLVGASGQLGSGAYTGAMDIAAGTTFQYASDAAQTLSGVISGAGTLLKDTADSTLTLTGVNTFNGDIDLDAGVLLFGASGQLESGAYTGAMDIASNATFQYASDAEQALSGVISGAGTLLKDTADSTLSLTGVNTFTGDIDLDAGVLLVGASGQLESGAYTGAMDIADGATFQYASDAAQTLSGVIDGTGLLLKDTANSTLTLTGINTFSGPIELDTGRLDITGAGQLQSGFYAGALDINNGAFFRYASSADQTLAGVISGGGVILKNTTASDLILTAVNTFSGGINLDKGRVVVDGTGQLGSGSHGGLIGIASGSTFHYGSSADQTLSGVIRGAGLLLKDTANSTLTLTGLNKFNGAIDLDAGRLVIGGAGQLGSGFYAGGLDINSGSIFQYGSSASQTVSGVISGAGLLLKDTAGSTLTLTGANTHSGAIELDVGRLLIANAGQLGLGSYAGAVVINSGSVFQYASSVDQTLSGVVSGSGLLVKDTSNAKITLTGANLYSGDIDIGMGVLSIGANGRLAPGAYVGALDIGSGATFQYASTASQRLSGVISGSGLLLKDTANSVLTLTGANTHTGAIDLDLGVLLIGSNGLLESGRYTEALNDVGGSSSPYDAIKDYIVAGLITEETVVVSLANAARTAPRVSLPGDNNALSINLSETDYIKFLNSSAFDFYQRVNALNNSLSNADYINLMNSSPFDFYQRPVLNVTASATDGVEATALGGAESTAASALGANDGVVVGLMTEEDVVVSLANASSSAPGVNVAADNNTLNIRLGNTDSINVANAPAFDSAQNFVLNATPSTTDLVEATVVSRAESTVVSALGANDRVAASVPFDNQGAFARKALEPSIVYNFGVSRIEIGAEATDNPAATADEGPVTLIESADPNLPEPDADTEGRKREEGADNEGAADETTEVVAGAYINDAQRTKGLRPRPHS